QAAFSSDERFLEPVLMDEGRTSSFHLYMLRVREAGEEQRDAIITAIAERGVSVNVHFQPLPLLSHYRDRGYAIGDVPNAYRQYAREISLPVYYDLSDDQVDRVITAVKEAVQEVLG
ncbi:MAG: DegT/DnrJ/EryC1/StrS family aminotransferase, partial [Flavobacteriales bacterium]|nr:DegT/DnrJ/EryC1/StrS family aminotransferase [Flavobacteriales bacterium]